MVNDPIVFLHHLVVGVELKVFDVKALAVLNVIVIIQRCICIIVLLGHGVVVHEEAIAGVEHSVVYGLLILG